MKRAKLFCAIFCFGFFYAILAVVATLMTACGSNNSPTSSATATPTPSGFTLSGTATYQGAGGTHNIYIFPATGANVPTGASATITSGGSYSFSGLSGNTELDVVYDTANTGLKISSNNLVESNGSSVSGSGDVTCVVGYTGSCPNTTAQNGTFYSSTTTVNIVFGGTTNSYAAGQSGTNCTQ